MAKSNVELEIDTRNLKNRVETLEQQVSSLEEQILELMDQVQRPRQVRVDELNKKILKFLAENPKLRFSPIVVAENIGIEDAKHLSSRMRSMASRGLILMHDPRAAAVPGKGTSRPTYQHKAEEPF